MGVPRQLILRPVAEFMRSASTSRIIISSGAVALASPTSGPGDGTPLRERSAMRPWSALRTLRFLPALLPLLLCPAASLASTGPTTPTFARTWGSNGSAPGQFSFPVGVATDALGNVYVADRANQRIQKFDRLGNFIAQWGTSGSGNGQFNNPVAVATDAAGNVYVVDAQNYRIQKFSAAGAYI